ncbi:unnamed protein product [Prunus brigantina]
MEMPRAGPPVNRRTQSELQEHRQRGLCFYCDDPYVPGHRCKQSQILMIEIEGEDMGTDDRAQEANGAAMEEGYVLPDDIPVQLHAIVDKRRSKGQAMRLMGQLQGVPILVFIDSGADRSFLNPKITEQLNQHIEKQSIETVVVASGKPLSTKGVVRGVPVQMQGYHFQHDYRLLAAAGCDLVLGVDWLETLGLVGWNFQHKTMEFTVDGVNHRIVGAAGSLQSTTQVCSLAVELSEEGWPSKTNFVSTPLP